MDMPSYRITKEQYNKALELIENTTDYLTIIAKQIGLSKGSLNIIQNKAIEEGILNPKYRRLHSGTLKWQYDRVVELLETTDYSLKLIGQRIGLTCVTVRNSMFT